MPNNAHYIFLDEGGDFNFSPTGSKYFSLTCVNMQRPFALHTALDTYKYDLIEHGVKPRINLEYFHCAEDNRFIKRNMFELLAKHLPAASVDTVLVEKRKTGPALQPPEKFYPKMLGYLLKFSMERCPEGVEEIVVITDAIPVNRKRRAVEKAIKQNLSGMLPKGMPYRLMHHSSKAHYGLQIADYLNWAIFRKYEKGDDEAYRQIETLVRSEFDIFQSGCRFYY